VNLSQAGFTVSFGDADTPAPPNVVDRGASASLTVSVAPASPTNAVDVVYWVDDGLPRTLSAWELRADHAAGIQYFRAVFPRFTRGKCVDYCPVARCAGGVHVPAPGSERALTATFALVDAPRTQTADSPARPRRFQAELAQLASGRLELEVPYVFGETPEGFYLDFHVKGGSLDGDPLKAMIRDDSLIELRVRPDGVGIADMHLVAITEREDLVSLTLEGKIDFGANSYQRLVLGNTEFGPFEMMATFETGSRSLAWLNRASVLAIGHFDMSRRVVTYDLVSAKAVSPS
jgi:hypothetical protein